MVPKFLLNLFAVLDAFMQGSAVKPQVKVVFKQLYLYNELIKKL